MERRDPVLGIILCMGVAFNNTVLAIDFFYVAPIVIAMIVAVAWAFTTTEICHSIYRDRIA
jgi:hypothetical protein